MALGTPSLLLGIGKMWGAADLKGRWFRGDTALRVLSVLLSALLFQSIYFHFLISAGEARWWHVLLALPIVAGLAAVAGRALRLLRGMAVDRAPTQLGWLALAFMLAGSLLTWAIPIPPAPAGMVELVVEATGTKSPNANSSEVWVRLQRDGVSISPGELQNDGKWHVNGEFLVSVPGRQPAKLTWAGEARGHINLIMVSHSWSGHAKVTAGGTVRPIDLYSEGSGAKVVTLAGEQPTDDWLAYPKRSPLQLWVQFGDAILIGAVLFALFLMLSVPLPRAAYQKGERLTWRRELFLHAMPTLLVGSMLLATYFPGLMTSDSLDQWRQAGAGSYNDAHPLLYGLAMRATRFIWDSPALLAGLQCMAIAFSSAWLITLVRRELRGRFRVAHAGAWLVALHPMVALTNITLWKDVLYTASVIILTCLVIKALFSRTAFQSSLMLLMLVIAGVAAVLLRHNGPPVAVAAFAIILIAAKANRKRVAAAGLISVGIVLLMRGPIPDAVKSERVEVSYIVFAHHLGAYLAEGHVPPEDSDRAFLRSLDQSDRTWRYHCATAGPTIFNQSFQAHLAATGSKRLRSIWWDLFVSNPQVELRHLACVSSLVWRITETDPLYLSGFALWAPEGRVRWIVGKPGDPREASFYPVLADGLGKSLLAFKADAFWRPALYLYVLIFGAAALSYRERDFRWMSVAVLCVIHSLVLMIASVAQDARYQFPIYVIALSLFPLLLVRPVPRHGASRPNMGARVDSIVKVKGPVSEPMNGGISVVIPCYRVAAHIAEVISSIGPEVTRIYCVDDACPAGSGDFIEAAISDPRVRLIRHAQNQGVGGAVMTGYRQAVADGAEVIVKVDGDGQMNPALIPLFVAPILAGEADYCKGNRFWDLAQIRNMPLLRRIGNLVLSFMSKASTGYWDVFDPTNGYTAIHASVAARLPLQSISRRYFFETDILFRLNTMRAVVVDVPMDATYGDEVSNLRVSAVAGEFAAKHVRNLGKRIVYNYFLRDMPVAALELLFSAALLAFGVLFGGWHWWLSWSTGIPATIGSAMLALVSLLVGMQLLLAFLSYDITSVPRVALHRRLQRRIPGLMHSRAPLEVQ